jgi:hypothetical protein
MDFRAEFKITPIEEFNKVSKENEFFFWHFIAPNHNDSPYTVQALSTPRFNHKIVGDVLIEILNTFDIKIFESEMSKAPDFLIDRGIKSKSIYRRGFIPQFYGFHNGKLVAGTNWTSKCYCTEGVTEVILQTYPPDKIPFR